MEKAYKRFLELRDVWSTDSRVRAVLGLGSLSRPARMDVWSDLDFFLIVEDGTKNQFLNNPSWLDVPHNGFVFQNTPDGFKALTRGDIFVECAVFTFDELQHIPYDRPHVFYLRHEQDASRIPQKVQPIMRHDKSYCLNEAITNLYIGVSRAKRGETFAAMTMIQSYAFMHYVRAVTPPFPEGVEEDPYVLQRRFEQAFPHQVRILKDVLLGYDHVQASARALFECIKKEMPSHPLYPLIDALLDEGLGQ
jgi:lincosamide nucleotidyltransferase B/F